MNLAFFIKNRTCQLYYLELIKEILTIKNIKITADTIDC